MEAERKTKPDGAAPKGKQNNKGPSDKKPAAIDRPKAEQENTQRDGPKTRQTNREAGAPKEKKEEPKPALTGPVVHVNKDLSAGAKWAKGNGPSFADMVRHKNEPARKAQAAAPEAPRREERKHHSHPPKAEAEAPQPAKQATPPPPTPPPAVAAPAEAAPAEPIAAPAPEVQPPAPKVQPPAPEVPPPAPSATFYVLEVERVDAVKLPAHVNKAAAGRSLAYTFSAQPGNPPPPVPAAQPQTIFRPDAANLNQHQWTAAGDGRSPNQWPYNGQGADWSMQGDRNYNGARGNTTFQYNSYGAPSQLQAAQQQSRGGHNFFPNRLRPDTNTFGGSRAAGGGVW